MDRIHLQIPLVFLCFNLTLLPLIASTTHLQQAPAGESNHNFVKNLDVTETESRITSQQLADSDGVQLRPHGSSDQETYNSLLVKPARKVSLRKLVSSLPAKHNDLPSHRRHVKLSKTDEARAMLQSASADDHPVVRKSNDQPAVPISTSTTTALTAVATRSGDATKKLIPHDKDHHIHDVDESSAFHVDYSGPKTHPPKNN